MHKRKGFPLFSWDNFGEVSRDMSVRVAYGPILPEPSYRYMQPHRHNYYCGFYVTKGEYSVEFENETVHMPRHSCILIRPENRHLVQAGATAWGYSLAVNQEKLLDTFLLHMAQNKVFSDFFYHHFIEQAGSPHYIRLSDQEPEGTIKALQSISEELRTRDSFTRDLAEIRFVIFLAQLARGGRQTMPEEGKGAGGSVADILWYIREHSASASLSSTAEYFHYNASYLSRLLPQETGQSFRGWQQKFRMDKAAFLLKTADYSVQAVAQLVGYSNVGSFYQAFQKSYRMTPSQYRDIQRKKEAKRGEKPEKIRARKRGQDG